MKRPTTDRSVAGYAAKRCFGMLALAVAIIAAEIPGRYPVTSDFSAWYAPRGWLEVGMVMVVALWSFRNALGPDID